jgi:hypothetical protein
MEKYYFVPASNHGINRANKDYEGSQLNSSTGGTGRGTDKHHENDKKLCSLPHRSNIDCIYTR